MQRRLQKLTLLLPLVAGCASRPGSIGAVLGQSKTDGRVVIRQAPVGLPAFNVGMLPGDEVLLIEGRDVRQMSPETIHYALEGDVGTIVHLTVLSRGQIERLALKRAPLLPTGAP